MKLLRNILCALAVLAICSCKREAPKAVLSEVTVVFAVNGLGDRSYTDGLYRGLCRFERQFACEGVSLVSHSPESMESAQRIIDRWFRGRSEVQKQYDRRILVLGANDYRELFKNNPQWKDLENGDVLMMDVDASLPSPWDKVYTRSASLYGISYAVGYTACKAGMRSAAVVLANGVMNVMNEASDGFSDGFSAAGGVMDESDVFCLGDGEFDGFRDNNQIYTIGYTLRDRGYDFVYPCCGGSIYGLLRFAREYPGSFKLCGMDTDMQTLSDDVPLSAGKHMGEMVYDFLEGWLRGGDMNLNISHLMDSPYLGILQSGLYVGDVSWTVGSEALDKAAAAEKIYFGL